MAAGGEGKRLFALGRCWQGGRRRWANQRAGLRHLIRTARLQPYGEGRAEARRQGETLVAQLERARELNVEI